jgi:chemotaxis protein methyltransferase CheR
MIASGDRPTAGGRSASTVVEGDFVFTGDDFRRIASMLYDMAGITLPESKATLVYSRLGKRLRALGLTNFRDYCALVSGLEGLDERQKMLAALTTNVTRFFREPHHFDHLLEHVIEPLIGQLRAGGRLRLWSAGCSTGQEPYSMALTVLSALPEAADLDVKILATDIDPNVIATAKAGVYAEDLVQAIPTQARSRWLERDAEDRSAWRVGALVQRLVTFKELNLMGPWPMKGPFHAIFCRNVVIYFDEPTQERIWGRFADMLPIGGRLYVGHSERVASGGLGYESEGLTSYVYRGASAR